MSANHFVLLESLCTAMLRYQPARYTELSIPGFTLRAELILIFNAADLRCQRRDLPSQGTLPREQVAAGVSFRKARVVVRQGKVSRDPQHAMRLFGHNLVFVFRAAI